VKSTRKFLFFIPVETRRSRRALVIAYYLVCIAFGVFVVRYRIPGRLDSLLPLALYCAFLLGGLSFSGPVRLFSRWQRKFRIHAEDRRAPAGFAWKYVVKPLNPPIDRLDEHDIAVRDRAHYLAYSALRWATIVAVFASGGFILIDTPQQVAHALYLLSVPAVVLLFSLPQAIILWTEPDLDPDRQLDPESASPVTPSGARHA
jgi:hypothetical protein